MNQTKELNLLLLAFLFVSCSGTNGFQIGNYSNCPELRCDYVEFYKDSTFRYEFLNDIAFPNSPTLGKWRIKGDTLILNSFFQGKIIASQEEYDKNNKHFVLTLLDSSGEQLRFSDVVQIADSQFCGLFFSDSNNYNIVFPKAPVNNVGIELFKLRFNYTLKDSSSNHVILKLDFSNEMMEHFPPIIIENKKYLVKKGNLHYIFDEGLWEEWYLTKR